MWFGRDRDLGPWSWARHKSVGHGGRCSVEGVARPPPRTGSCGSFGHRTRGHREHGDAVCAGRMRREVGTRAGTDVSHSRCKAVGLPDAACCWNSLRGADPCPRALQPRSTSGRCGPSGDRGDWRRRFARRPAVVSTSGSISNGSKTARPIASGHHQCVGGLSGC